MRASLWLLGATLALGAFCAALPRGEAARLVARRGVLVMVPCRI